MIVVTWVVPAILFFVSIFGWEHFVGKRDLNPGECMVQFLKDPVFNTSLIVGYYWIPLTILIVLYSQIFHSAWTLSKKAADKERERQKLLAALARKPSSDGTPPQISKKATNTALGIAAVAMASSFAASNSNKEYQAEQATAPKLNQETKSEATGAGDVSNKAEQQELLPCTCQDEVLNEDHQTTTEDNQGHEQQQRMEENGEQLFFFFTVVITLSRERAPAAAGFSFYSGCVNGMCLLFFS